MPHVANISAEEAKACEDSRVSCTHKDSHRKESSSPSQSKGKKKPYGQRIRSFLLIRTMKKNSERVSREMFSTLSRPLCTVASPFMTLRFFSSPKKEEPVSFLVTISKKDVPTAVKRNFLRRRYSHILRTRRAVMPSVGVLQCIVKKNATNTSFQELSFDMEQSLKKIRT